MLKHVQQILVEYGLNESATFELIHDGLDNNAYLVSDTNDRKYVLRESKGSGDHKNIDFEVQLLLSLLRLSIHVPEPLILKSGEYYLIIGGKQYVLFNHIEGYQSENINEDMFSRGIIELGGKKLGELHRAVKKIDIKIEPQRTIFTEFEKILIDSKDALSHLDSYDEFLKYLETFYRDAKKITENQEVECGMIHNDYRIQNLIFSKDYTDATIIDFDWSCHGPLLKDIGLAVAEWSMFDFKKGPAEKAIRQFIVGYNQAGPVQVEYDSELLFWVCFACLSDACTFFSNVLESKYGNLSINRIEQCRMYKKFKYFLEKNRSLC